MKRQKVNIRIPPLTDRPRLVPSLNPCLPVLLILHGNRSERLLGMRTRWYKIESNRGRGDFRHLRLQHLSRLRGLPQLDVPLPRPVRVRRDALVSGVIPLVQGDDGEYRSWPVTNLRDHLVIVDLLIAVDGPTYGGVRYALGYAADVHGFLVPRPDACVRHRGERWWKLDGQMADSTRVTTGVLRDTLVQSIVRSEGLGDGQRADGLAVIATVLKDDPVVVQLGTLNVRLLCGQLPESDLGRRPAERLAHQRGLFVLDHCAVQELDDLRLHDHVHHDVGVRRPGQIRSRALVLSRIVPVHVGDREHTRVRIDRETIHVRQILVGQRFNPGEFWGRLASGLALYTRVLSFDHVYGVGHLAHRRSYVDLLNETQTCSIIPVAALYASDWE